MKSLLILCLFVAAAYGHPAAKHNKDAEVLDNSEENFFVLPFGKNHNRNEVPSVVEVEVGNSDEDSSFFPAYFRPLFFNPFSFMNFGFSDFFSRPSWGEVLVPKDLPEGSIKNSTSTTKVVDGRKITVNDTLYENEKNGAVYRFQVIEILPADSQEIDKKSEEKTDKPTTEEKDVKINENQSGEQVETTEAVKPDQNAQDNEIRKEELASNTLQDNLPPNDNLVEAIDVLDSRFEKRDAADLKSDIRINSLLAENARRGGLFMIPPDVELLDYDQSIDNYQRQEIVDPYENQQIIRQNFNVT